MIKETQVLQLQQAMTVSLFSEDKSGDSVKDQVIEERGWIHSVNQCSFVSMRPLPKPGDAILSSDIEPQPHCPHNLLTMTPALSLPFKGKAMKHWGHLEGGGESPKNALS